MKSGKTLRDEGIAIVTENAGDEFNAHIAGVIETLAAKGDPFTSDDVRDGLSMEPHHANAIGAAVLNNTKRLGLRRLGYQPSRLPKGRHHVIAVWGI